MNQIFLPEYPYSYKLLLINLFADQQQKQQQLQQQNQLTIDLNSSIKPKEDNILLNKIKASILFNHNIKYHIKQTKLFNLNNNNIYNNNNKVIL
jgi:hypothetical protein